MSAYREHVTALFEDQGFNVETHAGTATTDPHLTASQDGTVLHIHCLPSDSHTREQLHRYIRQLNPPEEGETILFTDHDLDNRQEYGIKDIADSKNIRISHFDPDKDEDPDLPPNMPSSYEIIGDIAIVNFDPDIENREEIADAIKRQNSNIKTVLAKTGELQGEYRVGEYETVLGTETETVHTEHGCRFRLDPTHVYFSERFGHERERVMEQIQEGEIVHVWFAGVGPFAILFARKTGAEIVHSIEKNPKACDYMEQNIELNKVASTVKAHCGDVRDIAPDLPAPDRIVMPLPGSAQDFLPLALNRITDSGTIHYYRFTSKDELWETPRDEINTAAEETGRQYTIRQKEQCGHYAPYVYRVCVDIDVP